MILSVDPGKHRHGCALWEEGELCVAWLTPKEVPLWFSVLSYTNPEIVDHIVIEGQRILPLQQSKGGLKGQNDMVAVAFAAGEAVGPFALRGVSVTKWMPEAWKGSVPKRIMKRRILAALSAEERDRIHWRSETLDHNIVDGIGLGLRYLRREYRK